MTPKERLMQFLKYKGLSQKRFAGIVGLSTGYVNSIKTKIRPNTMVKISSVFPELNTSWLLRKEGDMLNPGVPETSVSEFTGRGKTAATEKPEKRKLRVTKMKKTAAKAKPQKEPEVVIVPDAIVQPEEGKKRRGRAKASEKQTPEVDLLKAHIRELEGENNRLKGKNEANEYTIKVLMKQFGVTYKQTVHE